MGGGVKTSQKQVMCQKVFYGLYTEVNVHSNFEKYISLPIFK